MWLLSVLLLFVFPFQIFFKSSCALLLCFPVSLRPFIAEFFKGFCSGSLFGLAALDN